MASIRCSACGALHSISITQKRTGPQSAVVKAVLDCGCGTRTGFELRHPDHVQTDRSILNSSHPGISDPVLELFRDAESAFWIGAFAASMASVRAALELALREQGLEAPDLRGLLDQAQDLRLVDENTVVRLGLIGVVRDDRQEFATRVDQRRALSALQLTPVALAKLAEHGASLNHTGTLISLDADHARGSRPLDGDPGNAPLPT